MNTKDYIILGGAGLAAYFLFFRQKQNTQPIINIPNITFPNITLPNITLPNIQIPGITDIKTINDGIIKTVKDTNDNIIKVGGDIVDNLLNPSKADLKSDVQVSYINQPPAPTTYTSSFTGKPANIQIQNAFKSVPTQTTFTPSPVNATATTPGNTGSFAIGVNTSVGTVLTSNIPTNQLSSSQQAYQKANPGTTYSNVIGSNGIATTVVNVGKK